MKQVSANDLRRWLDGSDELALIDVREEGAFSKGHLFAAVCVPLSHMEVRIGKLVPRLDCPIVLCDADGLRDGLAQRAATRLHSIGYTNVAVLANGSSGWRDAGHVIFTGVNVPSKAFGEFVEHWYDTPRIEAAELLRRQAAGERIVILDSRPMPEFQRMSIPGGIDCPGAELVYRVDQMVTDPQTTVVVNCAGRTRSIIGAQSLINAGIDNPVLALKDGTMGWELAGYEVARGHDTHAPDPGPAALARACQRAAAVARRFGVQQTTAQALQGWQREAQRTTFVLDVRTEAEYLQGHWPGARHAPGGQLVQATDEYVGVRNARIVLCDSPDGVRSTMTASWLIQLGCSEVWILPERAEPQEQGWPAAPIPGLQAQPPIGPAELASRLASAQEQLVVIDLASSLRYRQGHIPGAFWSVRARLPESLAALPNSPRTLVLTSPDGVLAQLAAQDLHTTQAQMHISVLEGGTDAFAAAGHALESGLARTLTAVDDVWWRPYEHKDAGPDKLRQAMEDYLTWEVGLVEQVESEGGAGFKRF